MSKSFNRHAGDLIVDAGPLSRYVIALPNLIDDLGLSPYAVRLYARYKRLAGQAVGGAVEATIRDLAAHCGMSSGKAWGARAELAAGRLIRIQAQGGKKPDRVDLLDLWPQNFARYAKAQPARGGDLRKYRFELPIVVDDLGLSVHAFRLLCRYVRAAGGDPGYCSQSARTLGRACRMSSGMVPKCKAELLQSRPQVGSPLIDVRPGEGRGRSQRKTDLVVPIDIWAANAAHIAGATSTDPAPSDPAPRSSGDRSLCSYSDRVCSCSDHSPLECSYSDRSCSPGDQKNIYKNGGEGGSAVSGLSAVARDLLAALDVTLADDLAQAYDPAAILLHACRWALARRDDPKLAPGALVYRIKKTAQPDPLDRYALQQAKAMLPAVDGLADLVAVVAATAPEGDPVLGLVPAGVTSTAQAQLGTPDPAGKALAGATSTTQAAGGDLDALWASVWADMADRLPHLDPRFGQLMEGAKLAQDAGGGYVLRLPDGAGGDWAANRLGAQVRFTLSTMIGRRADLSIA